MPNKQDGLGYGRLIRMENGPAMYGAFVAVVLCASKQRTRKGYLTDTGMASGYPFSADDLSIKTQMPKELIESMFKATLAIGWIECTEVSPEGYRDDTLVQPRSLEGRNESNEGKQENGAIAPAPSNRFEKPSLETVKLQAAKIGLLESEAEKFFNYYEANGWRVGRNPMKSWPHALINWKNNCNQYGTNQPTSRRGHDRSQGTLNEGKSGDYAEI